MLPSMKALLPCSSCPFNFRSDLCVQQAVKIQLWKMDYVVHPLIFFKERCF